MIRMYECLWGSWGSYIWHYLQERKSEVSKRDSFSHILLFPTTSSIFSIPS